MYLVYRCTLSLLDRTLITTKMLTELRVSVPLIRGFYVKFGRRLEMTPPRGFFLTMDWTGNDSVLLGARRQIRMKSPEKPSYKISFEYAVTNAIGSYYSFFGYIPPCLGLAREGGPMA